MRNAGRQRTHNGARNRYQIVGTLGAGGMAVVFDGIDIAAGRRVALKTIRATCTRRTARARLEREADAMAKARDQRICAAYAVAECAAGPCLVMERLTGETLQARIARGPIGIADLIAIADQVAAALAAVHAAGLVHQDIKPANIFISGRRQIKLLDFGLATAVGTGRPGSRRRVGRQSLLGTANYIAPERILGWTGDPRSDLFSLGAVIYEMAAGAPPFRAASVAAGLINLLENEPPPLKMASSPLAAAIDRIVHTALAKHPDARYQSAGEIRHELSRLRLPADPMLRRVTIHDPFLSRGVHHAAVEPSFVHTSCVGVH